MGDGPSLRDVGAGTVAELRRRGAWILALLERWSRSDRWYLTAILAILLAALFVSFPSLDGIGGPTWDSVHQVGQQPFTDLGFASDSHDSKNLFRVTVPIVGEALGLSPAGYMVVQALFGVLLIGALLVALERATSDRVSAFLLTLTACMTYPGVVAFVEVRGVFDGVALSLLLVALAWPRPALIASMVFLAGWTDERTLLASGFLIAVFWFQQLIRTRPDIGGGLTGVEGERADDRHLAKVVAVIVGVAAYGATRIAVVAAFALPQATGGVGPKLLLEQINNAPVGVWTGLEGLWIALGAALWLTWRAGFRSVTIFVLAVTGAVSALALSVADITRSMGYLLPSVVLSALVLATMLPRRLLRRLALVCLAPSMFWPIYYVASEKTISWMYPLPVQLLRMVTGVGS